jgi:hypothetical protein
VLDSQRKGTSLTAVFVNCRHRHTLLPLPRSSPPAARRTLTHGCNVKILATETESHTTIKNGLFFVDCQTCRMLEERLAPQYGGIAV